MATHPVRITVSAPVYPTEDPARVGAAIAALFPDTDLEDEGARLVGVVTDPDTLGRAIVRLRIPDTARGQLYKGKNGERTVVFLNKQAASVGRLNFAPAPGPLGDIRVEIVAASETALDAFIDAAAPDTRAERYKDPGFPDPDAGDGDAGRWRKVPGPWRKHVQLEEE